MLDVHIFSTPSISGVQLIRRNIRSSKLKRYCLYTFVKSEDSNWDSGAF